MHSRESKNELWSVPLMLIILLAIYFLSSGPVYRLWPNVAPSIYRPLEVPARTQWFTNAIRAYLCFWGVKWSPY